MKSIQWMLVLMYSLKDRSDCFSIGVS